MNNHSNSTAAFCRICKRRLTVSEDGKIHCTFCSMNGLLESNFVLVIEKVKHLTIPAPDNKLAIKRTQDILEKKRKNGILYNDKKEPILTFDKYRLK